MLATFNIITTFFKHSLFVYFSYVVINEMLDNFSTRYRSFTKDNQDLKLRTDDFNNAVYIKDSTERVGIGTSSPNETLHVAGNLKVDGTMEVTQVTSSIELDILHLNCFPSSTNCFVCCFL